MVRCSILASIDSLIQTKVSEEKKFGAKFSEFSKKRFFSEDGLS